MTVFALSCSADGSGLLILPLVNSFHNGLRAVFLSRWQWIAHYFSRQRLSRRFSRRIASRMAADCALFHASTPFTTVCAPYCPVVGSGLLILALVNGFQDGLRAVFLTGWRRIAHSFSRQRLSRRFSHHIAKRMTAHCSFFRASMAFTMACAPYCLSDCSLDRLFFRSYATLPTVCMPYGSTEGKSAHLWVHSYVPLVDDFANILCAVDCSPYRSFIRSSTFVILDRFAYRIPLWVAADYSFLHSSTAFTMVFTPYCSADG